ncbi:23S rRNA (uracil(1939)-C(5))-methyltransferase RlmD, partial [Streptococcus uberis]
RGSSETPPQIID